jgi:DNA-binding CsgD family transcriptional regulator
MLLSEEFVSVLQVASREELLASMVRFTQRQGFQLSSATHIVECPGGEPEMVSINNVPRGFDGLFTDRRLARRNPVMQHCRRTRLPIVWNQQTYTAVGEGELWEAHAPHGFGHGMALALHLPGGRHFCLGGSRDRPLPADPAELSRMAADLQLFAVHAQEAAERLLKPGPAPQQHEARLTPRELECLRWTMEGKTAWELGRILGISEQTAARHVNKATHKLRCVNKYHAVLKALRLGLIV